MNTTYYCIGLMSVVYIIVILFVIIKANGSTEFIIRMLHSVNHQLMIDKMERH